MNEQERSELERLKQRHALLGQELQLLANQLKQMEARLATAPAAPAPSPAVQQSVSTPAPAPVQSGRVVPPPIPVPPIIQSAVPVPSVPVKPAAPVSAASRPGGFVPNFEQARMPESQPRPKARAAEPLLPGPEIPIAPPKPESATAPAPRASFELRLGTYWLVRIGAVLFLTGLVFLGMMIHPRLGPGGKVAMLYLASGLLLGAGAWWQRRTAGAALHNYAQVLFAAGLAAVYFTTYAAHHVKTLHVITSPLLDGALLLGWAGFIAWIADRRKSELLAMFGVGLAYYTSVITPVGSFTLYSNLVLTLAALFFLVRNRWAGLSWASLVATYAAYAWWRFFHGGEGWHWATPDAGLWFGASFLYGYWVIFTVAGFLSKHPGIAGERRAAYLTFNNGAMFALFILTMLQVNTGGLWKFMLIYGAVLLALAELARRLLAAEPITKNSYLTQGLVLVTAGLVSKYLDTPRTLALVLAAESVILFILGTLRKNIFLQTGAYVSGAMAVGWGIDGLERNDTRGLWLGTSLGALMIVNAFWSHWRMAWADRRELRPVPAYFTLLALIMWFFTIWEYTTHADFGLVLVLAAIALTLSIYALRVPEIPLLGISYIILAQSAWAFDLPKTTALKLALALAANGAALLFVGEQRKSQPLKIGACTAAALAVLWGIAGLQQNDRTGLVIGAALGLIMAAKAFWMHQRSGESEKQLLRPFPAYFTLLALGMWIATTWRNTSASNFPLALALEAAVLTASVYVFRVREFAVLAQGALVLAHLVWLSRFVNGTPLLPWWNPLLMIAVTLGLSHWWQKQKAVTGGTTLGLICQSVYALALVGIVYFWLEPQNSAPGWLALTSLLAVVVTAYGVATRTWPLAIFGQIFLLVSAGQFVWQLLQTKPGWQFALAPVAALGLLSFATLQWFARKPDSRPEVRDPLLQFALVYRWIALVMSLWWVTEYINERERVWVFMLAGLLVFLFAGRRQKREALFFGAAFTVAGLMTLWVMSSREMLVYAPNFLAVLGLLGQQQLVRRLAGRYNLPKVVQSATILVGSVTLWRLVSEGVLLVASGFYLTASWSALAFALFGCGVVLREKIYRWAGLGILAAALGRVVVFDVWKLETIYRVLSFMALGLVLLVLGFIYNKYQEKIRQWL